LLLVDDDPHLGLIVTRLAQRAALEAACAADVASAWSSLQAHTPDLVLLDVNLPGASGLELLRRLRASQSAICNLQSAIPKVALFCQPAQVEDIAAGWRAGADYLLPKDLVVRPEDWQRRVREILSHAHGQHAPRSLTWPAKASGQTTCDWAAVLEQALRCREARSLGGEVAEVVLRRALDQAFQTVCSEEERARWIVAGQGRLDRQALPGRVSWGSLQSCFASLVDQWWCLLGDEASAPLVQALQAALDRA
jgi:DNA-binding response OmpR family regulator